jgi:hypothetical protein
MCHGYLKKSGEEDSSCQVDFFFGKKGKTRWSLKLVKNDYFTLIPYILCYCLKKSMSISLVCELQNIPSALGPHGERFVWPNSLCKNYYS